MLPDSYFERFATPKYRNKNPIQRALIRRFVSALHSAFVGAGPVKRVVEVGVGEGFLSGWLSERFPDVSFTGIDMSAADIAKLREKFPRIDAHVGRVEDLGALERPFDLVMCCEVLEHVDDPDAALQSLLSLQPKRLLLSVPHEPFFMLSNLARLKNVTRLGNDPEHLHHWGARSFRRFLEKRLDVEHVELPYPWILTLSRPR
ncbi:MAG: class I SAM-dependent methyltransferase [Polyangiaceae bacterium]